MQPSKCESNIQGWVLYERRTINIDLNGKNTSEWENDSQVLGRWTNRRYIIKLVKMIFKRNPNTIEIVAVLECDIIHYSGMAAVGHLFDDLQKYTVESLN